MEVPFLDLKRQYQSIKEEVDEYIDRVLKSQHFILGEEVESFEKKIAKYCRVKHTIGVASGTDALLLSLRATNIGKGDKVIITPFTFFATAGSIYNAGAEPVFADIEFKTYNIDPVKIRELVDPVEIDGIKAIIPVHLFGQMANMRAIMKIAEKHDFVVIEDAAQSIGAEFDGMMAGTIGNTGCFSFFPTKNLGGYGDGGMVTTNEDMLAERIRALRVHGAKLKYNHSSIGYNSRLDAIQAAVLKAKLKHLDDWTEERRKNGEFYNKELGDVAGIVTPKSIKGNKHVYNQYTIRVKNGKRDGLKKFLERKGISSKIYYPLPLHLQKCFSHLGYNKGDFPIAEEASKEVLSLPIFPELTHEEKEYVIEEIREFFVSK